MTIIETSSCSLREHLRVVEERYAVGDVAGAELARTYGAAPCECDRCFAAKGGGPWMVFGHLGLCLDLLLQDALGTIGMRRVRHLEVSLLEEGRWIYALLEKDEDRFWEQLPVVGHEPVPGVTWWGLDEAR